MTRLLIFNCLSILLFCACQPSTPQATESENTTLIDSAALFSPNVLSSELPEFATSFTADGNTVFFNRTSPDRSLIHIYSAKREGEGWSKPEKMVFSDTTFRDVDPFISANGKRLYFSTNRSLDGKPTVDFNIWYSDKTTTGWSAPQPIGGAVNSPLTEIYTTFSSNGNMYLSIFPENRDSAYIARSTPLEEGYSTPERVRINSTARLTNPTISPNEDLLIVSTVLPEGFGGADLYICYRQADGSWSAPKNLGPKVNSSYTEFASHITPDGQYLYFTSERPGIVPEGAAEGRPPGDLYRISLASLL